MIYSTRILQSHFRVIITAQPHKKDDKDLIKPVSLLLFTQRTMPINFHFTLGWHRTLNVTHLPLRLYCNDVINDVWRGTVGMRFGQLLTHSPTVKYIQVYAAKYNIDKHELV